jgi:SOS-response transcriptional repressor LexA
MVGAGILDGDLLFVKKQEGMPKEGEIVVANVESHGSIVKRFRYESSGNAGEGQGWLDSENPSLEYRPIPVQEDTRIQGRVVGLLRDF